MYRAMTLKILRSGIDPQDCASVEQIAGQTHIQLKQDRGRLKILLDGEDVTAAIRTQEVTKAVSAVSSLKVIRDVMVREQRRMGMAGGVVLEGRDVGTIVFPGADLKVFMVADLDERARRRKQDLRGQGTDVPLETLKLEISERDRRDSGRQISPLRKADDAVVLDTTNMTIDEQVEFIVARARMLLAGKTVEDQH